MDFNDLAAKAARAISNSYGKKVLKKGPAPILPVSRSRFRGTLTVSALRAET